ncbi:MAG: formate dehydrogenase accessory sulfurtransferase FdhD [Lachnospiraceae bacterium]|nr:formate dehydrogenase accessory sulfurtransferase FdhD [Lachnospiraceae bacterium]
MPDNYKNLTTSILFPGGDKKPGEATVISEHILTVIINERPVYRLVCTKKDLKELVTGRLLTDGYIEKAEDIYKLFFCRYENEASVFLNKDINWEETAEKIPTCCTGNRVFAENGNKKTLKKLPAYEWKGEWVFSLLEEFRKGTEIHSLTGGSHVCVLAREGKTVCIFEDIGRHNAVDKAAGYALLHGIPLPECMIFTSGRVPADMVTKVIAAGIPVLVSKSVPTAESVGLAEEYGLTLIGRAWPDQCEIFSANR